MTRIMKWFSAAIVAVMADAVASDNCDDCKITMGNGFCGVDGQCHQKYTCASFYEFGPENYTNGRNDDAPDLECQDIPFTKQDPSSYIWDGLSPWSPSVEFGCRSITPERVSMGFTKRCLAMTATSSFTCYELSDGTDFQPFLIEVDSSGMDCSNDTEYNETGWPKYSYRVMTGSKIEGADFDIFNLIPGFNATSEFNSTKALSGTMFSLYEEWRITSTEPPMAERPTEPPTNAPVNSALLNWHRISAAGIVVFLASLVF